MITHTVHESFLIHFMTINTEALTRPFSIRSEEKDIPCDTA